MQKEKIKWLRSIAQTEFTDDEFLEMSYLSRHFDHEDMMAYWQDELTTADREGIESVATRCPVFAGLLLGVGELVAGLSE